MTDSFGRTIEYMRISVTDRCNLRCRYCMPNGIEQIPMSEILTFEEIRETAEAAASLGISKLKVTGGEPLVRRGCTELISMLKNVPGIEQVTLTTNGMLLSENLEALKKAGIDGINISLDTLKPERFKEICGTDGFDRVMCGIDAAIGSGIPVKINTVPQGGINDDEWLNIIEIAKDRPIDVRFIEMMPIGYGAAQESVSNYMIELRLKELYPALTEDKSVHGNGPARYVRVPGFRGSIGFISAIHGKFCSSCNRIRLTSTGRLKPCLCYGDSIDLRHILREKSGMERRLRLTDAISKAISMKPVQHCFEDKSGITEQAKMAAIGG